MSNTHSSLTESEIHKLIASQAYHQSSHPEHQKKHHVVREWFSNRYSNTNQVRKNSATPSPWQDLGKVLLIGEGNLSFAKSLLSISFAGITGMIATTYEAERSLPDKAKTNSTFLT